MKPSDIPALILEKWALGECTEEERIFVEARLPDPEKAREEILGQNRVFLEKNPWANFEKRAASLPPFPEKKFRDKNIWLRFAPFTGVLTLGIAAFFIWTSLPVEKPSRRSEESFPGEVTRKKGLKPYLSVYRKNEGKVEKLNSGDRAKAGSQLRIVYNAAGLAYGAIFSVDGAGALTWHYPLTPGGRDSFRLNAAGEQMLSEGYELDQAPDFERFFLVAADKNFDSEKFLESIFLWHKTGRDLENSTPVLSGVYQIYSLSLKK